MNLMSVIKNRECPYEEKKFFALVLDVLQVICFVHITALANEGTNELDIQNIFSNESLIRAC